MATNIEIVEQLAERLYSQVYCGPPTSFLERTIGYGYPIALIIIALVTVVGCILLRSRWNWRIFLPIQILCSITGWFWGIYIQIYDPDFPGWIFLPWSISNVQFILTLEDWLFYPLCTFLFYFLFRLISKSSKLSNDSTKLSLQIFHIATTCFFCYFSSICGKSLSYQCAIPAIVLFFYIWDRWDVRHYLKFMALILFIEIMWDFIAVSWLSYIPGMAWASHWVYIIFDAQNNYAHSRVFLDYGTHRWAWIFKNPIEITPWFALSVGMYFYSMTVACQKLISSGDVVENSTLRRRGYH
jgi:hypothetical protein